MLGLDVRFDIRVRRCGQDFMLGLSLGSSSEFLEHFSVNLARSAKIDNSSAQYGEQSDFFHKIFKSNA